MFRVSVSGCQCNNLHAHQNLPANQLVMSCSQPMLISPMVPN